MVLRAKGIPPATDYFTHRSCTMSMTVQGSFAQRLPVLDVVTGLELAQPLSNLPLFISMAMKVVSSFAPAFEHDLRCEAPYALSPLAASVQTLHVSKLGEEPCVLDEVREDVTAWGLSAMSVSERQSFFSSQAASSLYFEPGLVYTFCMYQDMLHCPSLEVRIPLGMFGEKTIALHEYLNQQPWPMSARLRNPLSTSAVSSTSKEGRKSLTSVKQAQGGLYLWNFEIWHEKLLSPELKQAPTQTLSKAYEEFKVAEAKQEGAGKEEKTREEAPLTEGGQAKEEAVQEGVVPQDQQGPAPVSEEEDDAGLTYDSAIFFCVLVQLLALLLEVYRFSSLSW
eukprot:gb/GEZN01009094.1/.p1 GENE.gb/GEZN01009094.1/~~gb/GEZN01009094.1/.p1  ORF type:complete len:338 (-),score=68.75 gb/GEZN01009094.1/:345-1358(-)